MMQNEKNQVSVAKVCFFIKKLCFFFFFSFFNESQSKIVFSCFSMSY